MAPGAETNAGWPEAADATLIDAVAESLVGSAHGVVELACAGWRFGAARSADGAALHQVLHELQLLEAILLYAAERSAGQLAAGTTAHVTVGDGLRIARGVHRAVGLLSRAAARGHAQAVVETLRRRFSMLRHDLRNPLGTIRNAIAFLEDDEIPERLRDPQRFRRMIARNAVQADALISQHLGDGAVLDDALLRGEVAIEHVALAVRRSLRDEAREAGVEIVVATELPVIIGDATAIELTLLATVAGALESGARRRVTIEPATVGERAVRIRIDAELDAGGDQRGLRTAQELARWAGGQLTLENGIVLELPASPGQPGGDLAGAGER